MRVYTRLYIKILIEFIKRNDNVVERMQMGWVLIDRKTDGFVRITYKFGRFLLMIEKIKLILQ